MNDKKEKIHQILLSTAHLPKHLIGHHHRSNVAEFLLHSLGQQECFNLSKVAYFIDNPDFDNLQGIAGYQAQNSYQNNHWDAPDLFSSHMEQMPFNQIVRKMTMPSIAKNKKEQALAAQELAYSLGIENPRFISWPVKHENYGLLVFEPSNIHDTEFMNEHLELVAHLLGFCPIF